MQIEKFQKLKEDSDEDSTNEIFNGYKLLSGGKHESYKTNVVINSMEVTMEINTKVSISILNYDTYLKLLQRSRVLLVDSNVMLYVRIREIL